MDGSFSSQQQLATFGGDEKNRLLCLKTASRQKLFHAALGLPDFRIHDSKAKV